MRSLASAQFLVKNASLSEFACNKCENWELQMDLVFRGKIHSDKYASGNPIADWLVSGFLESVERLVRKTGCRDLHEIGCGEGHITSALFLAGYNIRGTDVSLESVQQAQLDAQRMNLSIDFRVCDLYKLTPQDTAPVVLCLEVLEHIEDPESALQVLKNMASPYLIASVPREPLWRILNMARLKYVSSLGNTPGHLNHWSSQQFKQFLSRYFEILDVAHPIPWTMVLCRRRD
jgi:SAM-dependent methyltransferase